MLLMSSREETVPPISFFPSGLSTIVTIRSFVAACEDAEKCLENKVRPHAGNYAVAAIVLAKSI